jgi:hypothetical protein
VRVDRTELRKKRAALLKKAQNSKLKPSTRQKDFKSSIWYQAAVESVAIRNNRRDPVE